MGSNSAWKAGPNWAINAVALTLCIVGAVMQAYRYQWMSDDAFISFRYAQNLTNGLGLVYNAGEHVEGYTNFLWTVWIALGLRLSVSAEVWSNTSSIVCYAAIVALLFEWSRRMKSGVPIAAIGAIASTDLAIWATGGLETALFSCLILSAYVLTTASTRISSLAGAILGLACMTRPDGVIFVPLIAAYFFLKNRRDLTRFVGLFLLLWLPFMAWRFFYYGDIFPNTYYAKSAYLTWWVQGVRYAWTFVYRYWILLAVPAVALGVRRRFGSETLLAFCMALAYSLYVIRLGGDFMFARFWIPIFPLLLVLLERGFTVLFRKATNKIQFAGACGIFYVLTVSPSMMVGTERQWGIVDERSVYTPAEVCQLEDRAAAVAPLFAGLPVNVSFLGGESRAMYRLGVPVAIESVTGLTDSFISHQPTGARTRPGHEKRAPISYLEKRKVCVLWPPGIDDFDFPGLRQRPHVYLSYHGQRMRLLVLNNALRREFLRRGATITPHS